MTNLTAASITATGTTETRTLGERFADVLNVKDFGATGDGSTDDTDAIQDCFDAAFGTWADPHGGDLNLGGEVFTNKAVFFPAGRYLVSPYINNRAITGAANNGSGLIRLTVSTTGLATGDPVCIAGVGGVTAANGLWFVNVISPTQLDLRFSAFSGTYTASTGTLTSPCLRIRNVMGAHIYGAGRLSSWITSRTANASALVTNGFGYSHIELLGFTAAAGGTCLQIDWTDPSTDTSTQSDSVSYCHFGGIAGDGSPKYGICIGAGVRMCSEILLTHNYLGGFEEGIRVANQNALSISVVGGNIATCAIGIHVHQGAASMIHGVAFQNQTDVDIDISAVQAESYSIAGCRSENSAGFLRTGPDSPYNVSGCSAAGPGCFFTGAGYVTLSNCKVVEGYVESYNARLHIDNCEFTNPNYLTAGFVAKYENLKVYPRRITGVTDATYLIVSKDDSSKIQFNRATAQTVTVDPAYCGLKTGAKIEVQQIGAGQVTFVGVTAVIRSSNGLKLRTQYSCATLTCDGPNLWTLTGDTVV